MPKADNLPPSCAVATQSRNTNFMEPSGPLQACNGTDLHLPLHLHLPSIAFTNLLMFGFCICVLQLTSDGV